MNATLPAPPGAADVAALLGADGPFAELLPGFRPRPGQQDMARAIADTLARREVLVCEAGTGTGKTFAYLVPALASGLKVIISTATKTLQDQLFHRDLPLVRRALAAGGSMALLKGRASYACLYRLERAGHAGDVDATRLPLLDEIRRWAEQTVSGDLEEVRQLDDDAYLRALVTSTTENCLGQECPLFDPCFVVRARRAAVAADVVVVNHHLLFADLVLRDTGFAELLPAADAIVLDEAHKVPEIASTFFSRSISAQQLISLGRDVRSGAAEEADDMPTLTAAVSRLELAQHELKRLLGSHQRRIPWRDLSTSEEAVARVDAVGIELTSLVENLTLAAERGPMLANCRERAEAIRERWQRFAQAPTEDRICWVDVGPRNFTFYDTPLSVAREFSAHIENSQAAWVMTSATLAIEGHFEHFCTALGLAHARTHLWPSPFDYARQSLLYLPNLRREPRANDFERELVEAAVPVLEYSRGRAFFLFTSYRSLDLCAALLRERLSFPLLIQGDAPRSELLRRFQATAHAVLLGTATFWEGVDVRGEQLSCVIIDKLPFGVPDDPVTQARSAALTAQGENPFLRLQLPEAITALKQGAGRLIRDESDRGVLMIGDVRLRRRGYGAAFIQSLPPMPVTQELEDVRRFYNG